MYTTLYASTLILDSVSQSVSVTLENSMMQPTSLTKRHSVKGKEYIGNQETKNT